jgi:hypothetical protein
MKTKFASLKSLSGYVRWGAAASAVLLSCGLPLQAPAAAFDSPVGQPWDVVMGGHHQGLAVFTFASDGTFSVGSILIPKRPQQPSGSSGGDDDRGTGGNDSRNGSSGTNIPPTLPDHTNVFGFGVIPSPDTPPGTAVEPGQWGFDARGRLVGYYTDVSGYTICVTNEVLVNNPLTGELATNIIVECSRVTNVISFVGTVMPGKRLTLLASTSDGKSVFSGVPVTTVNMPDISGQWTGLNLQDTLPHAEFFTLTRNDPSANVYAVSGAGPGYLYGGVAILSKSGKFAFAADINQPILPTEKKRVRSVIGTLNKQKINFRTGGLDLLAGTPDLPNHRVKFTAARISVP